jgi:sugar phosphate isomerase/epimerase
LKYLLAILFAVASCAVHGQRPEIIVVQDMGRDSLMKAAGYRWFVESIAAHFSPRTITEAAFPQKLAQVRSLSTKLYACNIFLPGRLKVVGPAADERAILAYADTVFRRVRAAGVNMIIFGSGGSRRVPEGFDHKQARQQFISISKQLARQARQYDIQIVLENLNHTETNFLNKFSEVIEVARAVNEPNFRICVDIYHMLMEGEPADVILKSGKYLVHCDIAERDGRTPPGTHGDDFTPYLRALQQVKYKGKITLECNWSDVDTQLKSGRVALESQLDDVYK